MAGVVCEGIDLRATGWFLMQYSSCHHLHFAFIIQYVLVEPQPYRA